MMYLEEEKGETVLKDDRNLDRRTEQDRADEAYRQEKRIMGKKLLLYMALAAAWALLRIGEVGNEVARQTAIADPAFQPHLTQWCDTHQDACHPPNVYGK